MFISGKVFIVSDVFSDIIFGISESVVVLWFSSVLCVLLMVQGEVIGVFYVGNEKVK